MTQGHEKILRTEKIFISDKPRVGSSIEIIYGELRVYVRLSDCKNQIEWLFDYTEKDKLNRVIEFLKRIEL